MWRLVFRDEGPGFRNIIYKNKELQNQSATGIVWWFTGFGVLGGEEPKLYPGPISFLTITSIDTTDVSQYAYSPP